MISAAKISKIHNNFLSCSYTVNLANETCWDESVSSEEVFGNHYNVYRDDRNYQWSEKMSGGGVLVAISTEFNSEIISTTKFKEFENILANV